jgi:hypothetical protein
MFCYFISSCINNLRKNVPYGEPNQVFLIAITDLQENLGWIIGSIATAIAMAIGWFISSG